MSQVCDEVQKQLPLYIDGGLSESEAESIKEHLSSCENCRKDEQFLRGISQTAKSLPGLTVTDNFRAELQKKLEAEKGAKTSYRRPLWRKVSAFAAAAAVIALSVITFGNLPEMGRITEPEQHDAAPGLTQQEDAGIPLADTALPEYKTHTESAKTEVNVDEEVKPASGQPAEDEVTDMTGGQARLSSVAKCTLYYTFGDENREQAEAVLSSYPKEADGYRIPVENVADVCEELEAMSGYVSHRVTSETPETQTAEETDLYQNYIWIIIQKK